MIKNNNDWVKTLKNIPKIKLAKIRTKYRIKTIKAMKIIYYCTNIQIYKEHYVIINCYFK